LSVGNPFVREEIFAVSRAPVCQQQGGNEGVPLLAIGLAIPVGETVG